MTSSIKDIIVKTGMNSQTYPTFDISHQIDKDRCLSLSTDENIGLSVPNNSTSVVTVGDILISTILIKKLFPETKTAQGFLGAVLDRINDAAAGTLKLDINVSPDGSIYLITNSADPLKKKDPSQAQQANTIWSIRDQFLPLNFADGYSLCKEISFNSDIQDSSKNIMNFTRYKGLEGANSAELMNFIST